VTDERFGSPRDVDEERAPRRVPIYDRRIIRPEDLVPAGHSSQEEGGEPAAGAGPAATAGETGREGSDMSELEDRVLEDEAALEADLKEEVRAANEKAAEHLSDLQRLQADFANYRKRVLREQTELVERAAGHLVNRLLSVLDSFELAVAAAEETKDFERMLRGVEMVMGELKEVLHAEGLETIPAKGQVFDPNLHEAALEVPGDEDGDMVVAGVLRPGYTLKGRILRPAMVKVTRRRTTTAGEGEPATS
jgi:molecular chaperone GrpE